jgi:hypothetical protein
MLQGRLRKQDSARKGFVVGNPAGPTHWTYDYFVTKADGTKQLFNREKIVNTCIRIGASRELADKIVEKIERQDQLFFHWKTFVIFFQNPCHLGYESYRQGRAGKFLDLSCFRLDKWEAIDKN